MDLSRFIPPILVGFSVLIQSENSSPSLHRLHGFRERYEKGLHRRPVITEITWQTFGDNVCHPERTRRIWLEGRTDPSRALRMTQESTPVRSQEVFSPNV